MIPLTKREIAEEQRAVEDLRKLLGTREGQSVFRYLIKTSGLIMPPMVFADPVLTGKQIGFIEAGHAIYNLVIKANPDMAATLLTYGMKEKIDDENVPNETGG